MQKKPYISMPVIRRLPRYYRFLRHLDKRVVTRISSKELSEKMGFTASQVRQDFNCFGGYGQQGYGYGVHQLCEEIGSILGVDGAAGAAGAAGSLMSATRDSVVRTVEATEEAFCRYE